MGGRTRPTPHIKLSKMEKKTPNPKSKDGGKKSGKSGKNFTKPFPTVTLVICYLAAFYLLTFAIRSIPVPIVYATWSGLGIFTIAIVSTLIFKQSIS